MENFEGPMNEQERALLDAIREEVTQAQPTAYCDACEMIRKAKIKFHRSRRLNKREKRKRQQEKQTWNNTQKKEAFNRKN